MKSQLGNSDGQHLAKVLSSLLAGLHLNLLPETISRHKAMRAPHKLPVKYPQNTFVILKTFFNINNSKPYHRQICLCTQKVNKPIENLQAKKSSNTSIQTFKETHVKHCLLMDNRMVPFSNSAGVPFKVINFWIGLSFLFSVYLFTDPSMLPTTPPKLSTL